MDISRGLIAFSLLGVAAFSNVRAYDFAKFPHKGIVQLSAGARSTCALLADRHVSCWGEGTVALSKSPLPVPNINTAVSVASGSGFACALLLDQTIWCWGTNGNGQLGDATFTPRYVEPAPVKSAMHPFTGAIAITAGDSHACAIVGTDHSVNCWGSNSDGQLGNWNVGVPNDWNSPVLVVIHAGSNPALNGVNSISGGARHTCATKGSAPATADCWGQEQYGRLGDGSPSDVNNPVDSPVSVLAPGSSDALGLSADSMISSGTFNACTLIPEDAPKNNSIACWGDNTTGQLGNSYKYGSYTSTPTPVVYSDGSKLENLAKISTGNSFACALLRTDGSIACWGTNDHGRLGNDRFTDDYSEVPVALAIGGSTFIGFEDMVTGSDHACALSGGDTVLCWGENEFGQLGTGSADTDSHSVPVNPEVDGTLFTDNFDGN